jgi:biopolymer transport protein ExbD
MAKRRHSGKDEILVVPFLDILCSLIGVLVLIIVVMSVSQSKRTKGRSPEELDRSKEYVKLEKEIQAHQKKQEEAAKITEALQQAQKELDEKTDKYLKLRRLIANAKDSKEQYQLAVLKLQKQLDDLLVEIEGLVKQQKESTLEKANLVAEIEKRQIPKDKPIPPVIVQPSGAGMGDNVKLYFVECNGSGLQVKGAWGEDYRLGASPEVVVADPGYQYFLTELKKDPNSMILFLIRDDGQGAFNNGAGRASGDYGIKFAKLPIPGRGNLDLALFEKYRGQIPKPPSGAGKPAAPAAPKPAA